MPPDPNQKMEELLKACAKQRREQAGAPFELHPATRRLLQGEVRRLMPPPAPETGASSSFFSFRRWLVPGAALATVTICAIFGAVQFGLFMPRKSSTHETTTLAFNQKLPGNPLLDAARNNPTLGDDLENESRKREIAKQDKYLESLGLNKEKLALAETGELARAQDFEKSKLLTLRDVGKDGAMKTDAVTRLGTDAGAGGGSAISIGSGTANNLTIAGGTLAVAQQPVSVLRGNGITIAGEIASTSSQPMQRKDNSHAGEIDGDLLAKKISGASGAIDLKMQTPALETVPVNPALPKSEGLLAGDKKKSTDGQDQLERISAVAAGKTAVPAILNTFEIRVDGDQIRLIDADGSVYAGKIQIPKLAQTRAAATNGGQMFFNMPVADADRKVSFADSTRPVDAPQPTGSAGVTAGVSNSAVPAPQAAKASREQQQQNYNYSFRASGTNLSLKKVVVVEGNYISEQPPGAQQQGARVAGAAQLATAMKQTAQNARAAVSEATDVKIQGQAQLGNEAKIEINAIAMPTKARN